MCAGEMLLIGAFGSLAAKKEVITGIAGQMKTLCESINSRIGRSTSNDETEIA